MSLYDEDGIDGPIQRAEERASHMLMVNRPEASRMSWALECLVGDFERCGRLKRGRIKRLATKLGLREAMLRDAWANVRLS
jgi:hypothetical protein